VTLCGYYALHATQGDKRSSVQYFRSCVQEKIHGPSKRSLSLSFFFLCECVCIKSKELLSTCVKIRGSMDHPDTRHFLSLLLVSCARMDADQHCDSTWTLHCTRRLETIWAIFSLTWTLLRLSKRKKGKGGMLCFDLLLLSNGM